MCLCCLVVLQTSGSHCNKVKNDTNFGTLHSESAPKQGSRSSLEPCSQKPCRSCKQHLAESVLGQAGMRAGHKLLLSKDAARHCGAGPVCCRTRGLLADRTGLGPVPLGFSICLAAELPKKLESKLSCSREPMLTACNVQHIQHQHYRYTTFA